MKFRTFIILCIHIVLAIILSIYLVFFYVDPKVQEIRDSDIRIIIDNQEEFDEAIKSDGRIYALGEIGGTMKASDISLDDLEYNGNNKENKVEKIKKSLDGDYVYIDFFSEIITKKTVKKEDPFRKGEYVNEIETKREPYAYLDFYDTTFSFYGYVFQNSKGLMDSLYDRMESTFIDGKDKEHVISATYLPDKEPMWLNFTVIKGQIDMDSLEIHSTNSTFDHDARDASGNLSPIYKVLSAFLIAATSFGIIMAIPKLFERFKIMSARSKRRRGRYQYMA